MRFFIKHGVLLIILFVAFLLRSYHISDIPVGIHEDEASIGYTAYSLLKTGKDISGNFLPLAINQFGDFRPSGYFYLDIPFVALFGLNEFSTRIPSVLFGSLTILVFYFLLLELFHRKTLALLGALLLAISPWHIIISRSSSEGVIAAFFCLLGFWLFVKSLRNPIAFGYLGFSFLSFIISSLFYHSVRFFIPALLLPIIVLLYASTRMDRKNLVYSLVLFIVLCGSIFGIMRAAGGSNRPFSISIFNNQSGLTELKHAQDTDGTQNPVITRFFHNKLFFYGRKFAESYFKHIDGGYWFINNGLPIRYKVPWSGNVHVIALPFILYGLAVLISDGLRSKKYMYLFPVVWLGVAAIPAGLTWEDIPNIQRSSMMIYAIETITAFGILEFFRLLQKKWQIIAGCLLILIFIQQVIYFSHMYFYHSRIEEPWHRSAAVKEVVLTVQNLASKYKKVLMTVQGNNYMIHFLYFSKFNPLTYQQLGSPKDRIDNIEYTGNSCPLDEKTTFSDASPRDILYIQKSECALPQNATVLSVIRHPDGIPAYAVVQ